MTQTSRETSRTMNELFTIEDVARLVKVAARTLRRWDSAGRMPEPIRKGQRCVRWRSEDISRWIALGLPDRDRFEAGRGRA